MMRIFRLKICTVIYLHRAKINDNLLSESEYNRIESDNNPAITMNDEEKKKSSLKKRFQEFEANYVVPIFKKPKT